MKNTSTGVIFMILTIFLFSIMNATAKGFTTYYPIIEIVWVRYLSQTVFTTLIFISCGSDQEINDTKIFLNFSHNVDGNPVSMDDLSHTNLAGENYNVLTLKYLISDIKLISNEKDHEKIIKDIHFVDLSDPSTMVIESDIIENGSYTLQFRFGLDATTNVTNSFVNETFHTSMSWPEMMGGGYHYMKLEGSYTNDSTFYNTHTGPTMGMDHSFLCSFDVPININNSTNNLEYAIEMNINNWYGPEVVNLEPAIMMNMPTQMNLMMNGMMGVFNLQGLLD